MSLTAHDVRATISTLRERLEAAAARSKNAAAQFKIVAVSKRHPASAIAAAYESGHRDFGENYALELAAKVAELSALADARWHFIGHLQRNKVAKVVGVSSLIHAVDSPRLLRAIDRRAASAGVVQGILIAVSLAGETQKSGVSAKECAELVGLASELANVECCGLMTMPPLVADGEENRTHFASLRGLRDALATAEMPLAELSMGTSADCEVAVEEGATLVRVGTAIFGPRVR